jgi:outer membrane protein TolC
LALKKAVFRKTVSVLASAALFAGLSFADINDEFIRQCMKIAESRDPKIRIAYEQVQLAEIREVNAGRAFFPQIMLQHRQSEGKSKSGIDFSEAEYRSEEYGIRASQVIYEGYRTRGLYEYESMMVDASRFNYTKTREELFAQIKLAYYEYLTLKQENAALGKAFVIVEDLFAKVKNEYKAKAISELDLVEAENFKDKVSDMLSASAINLDFSTKKLIETVGIHDLNDINASPSDELPDDVAEIAFTIQDLKSFVLTNNLDVQSAKVQQKMADMKIKIGRAKVIPKFYLEGFYGKSGEAYTKMPLELSAAWNVVLRMSWSLWGNSLEASYTDERVDPGTIVDASRRVETNTYDIKFSILDDLAYFVESKEAKVGLNQSNADYIDTLKARRLEVEKAYNEYVNSLNSARTLRKEMILRERKLRLMQKRNFLYEVPTVSLMEESWKYAEAISSYARTTYQNHASVTEMERITLMPLR